MARHLFQVPNTLPILSAATSIGHQDVNQFENGMKYRDDIGSVVADAGSVSPKISN